MISIKKVFTIGNGPSSSHTIGPQKACEYIKNKYPNKKITEIIIYNSLALTSVGHGTNDVFLSNFPQAIITKKIDHQFSPACFFIKIDDLFNSSHKFESIGGGLLRIDDFDDIDDLTFPHNTFDSIKLFCHENNLTLINYIKKFENDFSYLENILDKMVASVKNGLLASSILPGPLEIKRKANSVHQLAAASRSDRLYISAYTYAVIEENANGNQIVTAPTCGACGIIAGLVYYYFINKNVAREKVIEGLAIAGLFGALIITNATIAGSIGGCQAEIGSATAMAAAMISYLNDAPIDIIECSAEIAIEHSLGLTCDPILGYVQIPCIERNVLGSLRALDCYELGLAVYKSRKISFDTVVKVMYETGLDLHPDYKETSLKGLAKYYT